MRKSTSRPKIHSHSQIFRYGRSIFCLLHLPNFVEIFELFLHWVFVVRAFMFAKGQLISNCLFGAIVLTKKPTILLRISALLSLTANIFEVIFTVFNCVPISTVVSLYGLHLIAAPSTIE